MRAGTASSDSIPLEVSESARISHRAATMSSRASGGTEAARPAGKSSTKKMNPTPTAIVMVSAAAPRRKASVKLPHLKWPR